jgi:DNA invertase Pin-like site-specific DNA recombinase
MKIGYARVSTLEQNLDLQLRALERAGCGKIFREKVSGSNRERPQFQRMLDQIRLGDTIVVWKLDRLARSTRDLLETMETIREAGGKFRSLSEPWADTTTHAGKMIMTIFAGIAEFERDLIRERTGAGREAARKKRSPIRSSSKTQFRSGAVGSAACSRRQICLRYRANVQCPCGNDLSPRADVVAGMF